MKKLNITFLFAKTKYSMPILKAVVDDNSYQELLDEIILEIIDDFGCSLQDLIVYKDFIKFIKPQIKEDGIYLFSIEAIPKADDFLFIINKNTKVNKYREIPPI